MALGTELEYIVFGPAIIQVGTGASNALEMLGYTVDGVEVHDDHKLKPIYTDVQGPELPAEEQKFGIMAKVISNLAVLNETILNKLHIRMANGVTAGVMGPAGKLLHTGGFTFRLALISQDGSKDPYYFPTARLKNPTNVKRGSAHGPQRIEFDCSPMHLATETTMSGKVAWSRTLPS